MPFKEMEKSRNKDVDILSIKAQFLTRQYRQCIQQCEEALASEHHHAGHLVFLHFYAALSNESLARLMHDLSAAKLPAFVAAESKYLEALHALPNAAEAIKSKTRGHSTMTSNEPTSQPLPLTAITDAFSRSAQASAGTCDASENAQQIPLPLTPLRYVTRHSTSDFSALFDIAPPPSFRQSPKIDRAGTWDLRATNRNGLIKTTSGTLFETSSRLPRSSASMQLLDPNSHQPATVEDESDNSDDVFGSHSPSQIPTPASAIATTDPALSKHIKGSSKAFATMLKSAASPTLSPIAQSEPGGSPTPSRPRNNGRASLSTDTDQENQDPSTLLFQPNQPDVTGLIDSSTETNIAALRTQLHKHIFAVQRLKLATIRAQDARTQRRARDAIVTPPSTESEATQGKKSTLPQSRSFWSFKDKGAEDAEKERRVRVGRARAWKRERFEGGRYVRLAEEAMAELGLGGAVV